MRSPLAWIAGAYALGIFLDRLWSEPCWWLWTVAALIGAILARNRRRLIHPMILAATIGLGALSGLRAAACPEIPTARLVEAEVISSPTWKSIPGQPALQQAMLRIEGGAHLWLRHRQPSFPLQYGDRVRMNGSVRLLDRGNSRSKEQSGWQRWLWARGADAIIDATGQELEWLDGAHGFQRIVRRLFEFKNQLIWRASSSLDPTTAATLNAFLLGERGGLSKEILEDFRTTGTYHILSVSGWHVTFLGGILWLLARSLLAARAAVAGTVLGLAGYCLLVGADPPIVRATLAGTAVLIGNGARRRIAPMNGIGLAALVILCFSPRSFWDVGFQLSFVCVISLAVLALPLAGSMKKWMGRFPADALAASFAAWIGSLPLVIYHLHGSSWIAIAANLLLVPLAGFVMITGLLFFAVASLDPAAALLWGNASKIFVHSMLGMLMWFADRPYAYQSQLHLEPLIVLGCYGLLSIGAWIVNRIYIKNKMNLTLDER